MLDEIKENCPFKDDISVCEFCGRLSVCYMLKEIIEMDLKKRLNKMPTIDAELVRHGHWGNYEPYLDGYRCSCCKLVHRTCTTYCPNCGAKMDEVSE